MKVEDDKKDALSPKRIKDTPRPSRRPKKALEISATSSTPKDYTILEDSVKCNPSNLGLKDPAGVHNLYLFPKEPLSSSIPWDLA